MSVQQSDTIVGADGNPALKLVDDDHDENVSQAAPQMVAADPLQNRVGVGVSVNPQTGMMGLKFTQAVEEINLMPPDWIAMIMMLLNVMQRLMTGDSFDDRNAPLQDIPPTAPVDCSTPGSM